MTVGEVHRYIWEYVVDNFEWLTRDYTMSLLKLKAMAVSRLRQAGRLNERQVERLAWRNYCVLCAAYNSCVQCPLGGCTKNDSLYMRAFRHDIDAAEKIRDVRFGKENKSCDMLR